MTPLSVTLEQAIEMLEQSAELKKRMVEPLAAFGTDPTSNGEIFLKLGRYGNYITDGITNASLGKKIDPADLTREMAIEILVKKRAAPVRSFGKKAAGAKPTGKQKKK